jgi:uncharacterized protein DUF6438
VWFKGGRALGPSAIVGVVALVAIEYAMNGGSFSGAPAPDPTFRARLDRSPCFGACPSYGVEIEASGAVTFVDHPSIWNGHDVCKGTLTWRTPAAQVARLEQIIDASGFFGFRGDYSGPLTDQPRFTVTVTRHGRTKTVSDYAGLSVGMPRAMTTVENAIDEASGDGRCLSEFLKAGSAPRH